MVWVRTPKIDVFMHFDFTSYFLEQQNMFKELISLIKLYAKNEVWEIKLK